MEPAPRASTASRSAGAMGDNEEFRRLFEKVQQIAASLVVRDVEALIGARSEALTRFANNAIHQNVSEQTQWLSIRVLLDHKTARSTTNRFDPDGIRAVVEQAIALTKSAAPDSTVLPLAQPSPIPSIPRFDPATAATTPEDRANTVAEAIRLVEMAGQTAAGIYSTEQTVETIFNSAGVAAWHSGTMAHFSITATAPDSSGWAKASAVSSGAFNPIELARQASEKARRSSDPREIPPGR